jgi:hypothetical protein
MQNMSDEKLRSIEQPPENVARMALRGLGMIFEGMAMIADPQRIMNQTPVQRRVQVPRDLTVGEAWARDRQALEGDWNSLNIRY